jgi:hypothetical protein
MIAESLENIGKDKPFSIHNENKESELLNELSKIYDHLANEKFSSDAFSTICIFLFEASNYLRQILDSNNEIEKSLALNEIVTTLTYAATYRFSHQKIQSHIARKNFAAYFREALSKTANPATSPPNQLDIDAVKVMTCHASKGLEFPFVIVAGQTLSQMGTRGKYKWLPPILCPKEDEDEEQSDSALFVGITRSRQGLVVSHAKTTRRKTVPLLQSWLEANSITPKDWNLSTDKENQTVAIEKIWGGQIKSPISSRKLDDVYECSIRTYLNDGLNLWPPVVEQAIYPIFHGIIKDALYGVVKKAFENQSICSEEKARQTLFEEWGDKVTQDHIHYGLYFSLAQKYIIDFASLFKPEIGNVNFVDLIIGEKIEQQIRLDVVCAYTTNGSSQAIFFRPESLKDNTNKQGQVLWSKIKSKYRNAFVMLQELFPNLGISIFSGNDGNIYPFNWPNKKSIENQKEISLQKHKELSLEKFVTEIKSFKCNNFCEHRLTCPYWIKN